MAIPTRHDPRTIKVRLPHPATLRDLERMSPGPGHVVSMFLDLDPTRFGTGPARSSQIRSLIDEAKRIASGDDDRTMEDAMADVERIEAAFEAQQIPLEDAKGLAVFVCSPREMFEVFRLDVAPQPSVEITSAPHLGPLAPYLSTERWGVLLVNRETSRFLFGPHDRLREVDRFEDEVHGRHKQGGWSQARYQRSVERDADVHLDRVAARITELHEKFVFDHLALGAPKEFLPSVEDALAEPIRRKIAGHLQVDVERTSPDQIAEELAAVEREVRRRRDRALLDRWLEQRGRAGRAAAGRDEIMEALREKRVETLLVRADVEVPDEMVELAVAQSAAVVVVEDDNGDLAGAGTQGIAALLRWSNR